MHIMPIPHPFLIDVHLSVRSCDPTSMRKERSLAILLLSSCRPAYVDLTCVQTLENRLLLIVPFGFDHAVAVVAAAAATSQPVLI